MYYYYATMQLNNGADAGAEKRLPRDEIWKTRVKKKREMGPFQ